MTQSAIPSADHFDVIIVGAGLSGVGAAHHLQSRCPGKTYAILEGRDCIGGTWDLFRYPGIRSDSDMYTLGYDFKPWTDPKAIADGPAILKYVRDTAADSGIDRRILFNHWVKRASWSTPEARWTMEVERGPNRERTQLTCNFLFMCSGYYSYEAGYTPDFVGVERYRGQIVHPQKWTDDIDFANKRVIVIGSGATAVTLVPELAAKAAHVTMLQRSPTYMVARPAEDRIANWLRRHLPGMAAYQIIRWRNVLLGMAFFKACRRFPDFMKNLLVKGVRKELGPDYDVATHFTPHYRPWDQRLCLVTNSDLFQAIKIGRASVVTDHIETFTERGITLRSGQELEADMIVTATGLKLVVLGGLQVDVDGERVDFSKTLCYKGMMYSSVPNLASAFGYTNASWTLKADLTSAYVCRVLNRMDRLGMRQCTPRNRDNSPASEPFLDFSSGYVQRAMQQFPKQGAKTPWKLHQNYALDLLALRFGRVDDGVLDFSNPAPSTKRTAA